jgi:ribokinase
LNLGVLALSMARSRRVGALVALALLVFTLSPILGDDGSCDASAFAPPIVVVGALNVDTTVRVQRPPSEDETVLATSPSVGVTMGGKGANQAVAAARLVAGSRAVKFVCVFGNDAHARSLEDELRANGVDLSSSGRTPHLPSGMGLVMLAPDGGASSVVVGGANTVWPEDDEALLDLMVTAMKRAAVVMLQREIPERVNLAAAAAARAAGAIVLLDAGGADAPVHPALLRAIDYLMPNESELARLTGMPTETDDEAVAAATRLARDGAARVLATLGPRGALLVSRDGGEGARWIPPTDVPGGAAVDATAAGDAFRAALAVSLAEKGGALDARGEARAAAAGASAVSVAGAVPSLPTRDVVEAMLPADLREPPVSACEAEANTDEADSKSDECPLRFGSRLNSMLARSDLWGPGGDAEARSGSLGTLDAIARLGTAEGISAVDLNYPQHLEGMSPQSVADALASAGLDAAAVAVRFPASTFLRGGAFTNPVPSVRAAAIDIVARACVWADELGVSAGVIVWPQFDGYNYNLQVNFSSTWRRSVDALREAIDRPECRRTRISYEFKPTDASSRFAVVPSTAAALALVREVNRPGRFGLTLDFGHLLAAGENPAQSAAAAAEAGALFGFHIGDAHSKLGAEDGLAFGSVHAAASLELVYWLRSVGFDGHVYFDTFPEAEDPVREAELNVRAFKRMWRTAAALERDGMGAILESHDAMGSLEMREAMETRAFE